jgi:hypothetical protein
MNVSKNEAQTYLQIIEEVQCQARKALAHGGGPFFMMIWGLVWFVGYLGNQFLPSQTAGMLWFGAGMAGMTASFFTGWWISRQLRRPGHDARIGLFWLAWLIYTSLIIGISGAFSDLTLMSVLIAIMAMFGYVVMGLWLWKPLAGVGILVTILAVAAYLLLPGYVNLIMAILGGGVLFISGLYIYHNWR